MVYRKREPHRPPRWQGKDERETRAACDDVRAQKAPATGKKDDWKAMRISEEFLVPRGPEKPSKMLPKDEGQRGVVEELADDTGERGIR